MVTDASFVPGPMSVNITACEAVTVEGDTFSWLLNMAIANVRDLKLGSGSFSLDPTAANVGDHGPGMSVSMIIPINVNKIKLASLNTD